jgi:photosystem II stability/assembly factor-like uncharacterized protein
MTDSRITGIWSARRIGFVAIFFLAVTAFAQSSPPNQFEGLRWRLIGPFRGGRSEASAGVPGDPMVYYFGSAAGGVFKTTNGGISWVPVFDRQSQGAIGAIAVAPSNPSIVYAGTGEQCIRNDIVAGDGIYRSDDAGMTWRNVGLKDSEHIATIIIDQQNPDDVFVAAIGHAFGPNEERGVFHTTDGGKNWQKILYVDDKTGATDLAVDAHDKNIMFASMYEVRRNGYSLTSGGPGSGLYKTTDGGKNWKHLEGHGLPEGILGKIGVTISGVDSNRIYAMIEAKENAIYRSDNGGDTWAMTNNQTIWVRPWYGNHIFADPKNADTVYVLDLGTYRSTDGGKVFTQIPVPHSDDHHLWIDPTNTKRMIESDDGGGSISVDGGANWTPETNQPTAQFYHAITDTDFNYSMYGSQQDSGSVAIRSRTDSGTIDDREWHAVGGGESGYILPDPRDPQIVYAGDHNGHFTRWDGHTGQSQDIAPWFGARAHVPADLKHRFQWTSPMALSPFNPDVLYLGGEVLFKSTTHGMSWTIISPDLTHNDKSKQISTPGPLTPDNSSAEYYDTIFAVAESPVQKDLIWAGSDDGLVHITKDGGKNWAKVTPKDLPDWSRVNYIEPSPWDAGTAYLCADLHYSNDYRPIAFKTTNFGQTWTPIINGFGPRAFVHSIHTDPKRKGLLYAGTEMGIYISFDDGANWQSLQLNLPPVPVYDTAIHGDDLIAATHGRAFWVLDNITPIRQAKPEIASQPAFLYTPAVAYRTHGGGRGGGGGGAAAGGGARVGQNPPAGAVIDYYLSAVPSGPVTIEIADSKDNVVHHAASGERGEGAGGRGRGGRGGGGEGGAPSTRVGINRFVWNYRLDPPISVPGFVVNEANSGPEIPPGKYQVKLTVGGTSYTAPLEIKPDPRVKVTPADFEKQYEFAVKLRDRVNDIHHTVIEIIAAQTALEAARSGASASKIQAIDAVEKKMADIEAELTQVHDTNRDAALVFPIMLDAQVADLMNVVESADSAPPQQTIEEYGDYDKKYQDLSARWKAMQGEITQLKGQ